jgi:hypothetical protein
VFLLCLNEYQKLPLHVCAFFAVALKTLAISILTLLDVARFACARRRIDVSCAVNFTTSFFLLVIIRFTHNGVFVATGDTVYGCFHLTYRAMTHKGVFVATGDTVYGCFHLTYRAMTHKGVFVATGDTVYGCFHLTYRAMTHKGVFVATGDTVYGCFHLTYRAMTHTGGFHCHCCKQSQVARC